MLPDDVGLGPARPQTHQTDRAALVHRDVLRYVGDLGGY